MGRSTGKNGLTSYANHMQRCRDMEDYGLFWEQQELKLVLACRFLLEQAEKRVVETSQEICKGRPGGIQVTDRETSVGRTKPGQMLTKTHFLF